MSRQIYYFGQFSLDPAERLLLRSGAPVGLSPKIFDLLLHLSGNAGRLVSKKELMDAVWAGTFVEEATLARAVSDLRKALGDGEAGQRFIETVPKFGYRFICDVAVRGADAEQGDDTAGPRRSRLRWAVGVVGAVVGLSGLIWIGVWNRPFGPATIESVAILPIRAESIPLGAADPGVSIADTLITSLSRATTLEVRSLNAVRRYAGKEVDPLEAGRELRVDAVLEGSLLSSGQKTRLNARLLRVKDGRTLWSGTIEEETGDPLSLQDQFASEVANSISSHLTEEQRAALADHGTTDRLAQQSLLRGRQYFAQRSGDGFRRAIECFEDAIRRDPNYGAAHSLLAEALFIYNGYMFRSQEASIARIRDETRKAIDLDPRLGSPHRVIALVAENYDYDRVTAEREYKIALRLDPRDATTHHFYAELLGLMGRFEEAERGFEAASRLDPTSLIIQVDWAKTLCFARRFDDALRRIQNVATQDPGFQAALGYLDYIRFARQEYETALEGCKARDRVLGAVAPTKLFAAMCLGALHRNREAMELLAAANGPSPGGLPSHFDRSKVYAWTGQPEKAMEELEAQLRTHESPGIIGLEVDPAFDPLRRHGAFQEFLRRTGAVEPEVVKRSAAQIMASRENLPSFAPIPTR